MAAVTLMEDVADVPQTVKLHYFFASSFIFWLTGLKTGGAGGGIDMQTDDYTTSTYGCDRGGGNPARAHVPKSTTIEIHETEPCVEFKMFKPSQIKCTTSPYTLPSIPSSVFILFFVLQLSY